MPMNVDIAVRLIGPLFTSGMTDKAKQDIKNITKKLVELGTVRLAQVLRKQPEGVYLQDSGSTGNYRRNVKPLFYGDYSALITDSGVVYGPWLEGVSSRNDQTRFKGYASFRKTGEWLNEQAMPLLNLEAKLIVNELGG